LIRSKTQSKLDDVPRLMTVELEATAVRNEFIPVVTYSDQSADAKGKQVVRGTSSSVTISRQPRSAATFDFTKFDLDWYGTLLRCSLTAQPKRTCDIDVAADPKDADLILHFKAELADLTNSGGPGTSNAAALGTRHHEQVKCV
jgi:hypothetical protein